MIVYNVSINFKRVKGVSAFSGIHHSYVNIEELQASVSQTTAASRPEDSRVVAGRRVKNTNRVGLLLYGGHK